MQRGEEGVLVAVGRDARGTRLPTARGMLIHFVCLSILYDFFIFAVGTRGRTKCSHVHAHPYTPPGKGGGLRGAFLSTHETGTGTGSGGLSAKVISVGLQIVVGVLGVASFTAVAVHHLDQRELAAAIKRAAAEMKRVEGAKVVGGAFEGGAGAVQI